jgi:hypothetical protein
MMLKLPHISQGATVKVSMDRIISWNLTDSSAGKVLSGGGWFYPLDDGLEST